MYEICLIESCQIININNISISFYHTNTWISKRGKFSCWWSFKRCLVCTFFLPRRIVLNIMISYHSTKELLIFSYTLLCWSYMRFKKYVISLIIIICFV